MSPAHPQRCWLQAERFNSHTFNGSLCSHRPNQYPLGSLGLWLLKTFSLSAPWSLLPHLLGSSGKGRRVLKGWGPGGMRGRRQITQPSRTHPSRLARGQAPCLGAGRCAAGLREAQTPVFLDRSVAVVKTQVFILCRHHLCIHKNVLSSWGIWGRRPSGRYCCSSPRCHALEGTF